MNIVLNFKEIVRQYVAPHRRQPNRLGWLWALVDLESVWDAFVAWRDYYRYKVHVTSQHKSLEGHLNKTFGGGILNQELRGPVPGYRAELGTGALGIVRADAGNRPGR